MSDLHADALERVLNALGEALEAIEEGITISDARQDDLPLVWVNGAFLRLTGYTRDEVIGRNCRFLQGPETDHGAVEALRESIAGRNRVVTELINYTKSGAPFWNRLSLVPVFDEAGEIEFFVGVQSDVTPLRRAQEQLDRLFDAA
jgi:PAS domain S-box-containing protein